MIRLEFLDVTRGVGRQVDPDAMPYNPAAYVLPSPRLPGGTIWTEVTWHPRSGSPHGALAAYAAPVDNGHIVLIPGVIPVIVADLGLPLLAGEHAERLTRLVNAQLAEHPHAEVRCPAGRAELVLHPRRR